MNDENKNDLQNEQIAEFQYNRHLAALGITQVRTEITPKHRKDCYDFQIFENGMWTGVAEVRSVNHNWTHVKSWGGFMLDEIKLKKLKAQFCSRSAVTGKPIWSKEIVFLFRTIPDHTLWAIHMREILAGWADWEVLPPEFSKSNHGKESNTKLVKRIPFDLMERVE